jgi:predicted RNA-binding protein with TRAM domain
MLNLGFARMRGYVVLVRNGKIFGTPKVNVTHEKKLCVLVYFR